MTSVRSEWGNLSSALLSAGVGGHGGVKFVQRNGG